MEDRKPESSDPSSSAPGEGAARGGAVPSVPTPTPPPVHPPADGSLPDPAIADARKNVGARRVPPATPAAPQAWPLTRGAPDAPPDAPARPAGVSGRPVQSGARPPVQGAGVKRPVSSAAPKAGEGQAIGFRPDAAGPVAGVAGNAAPSREPIRIELPPEATPESPFSKTPATLTTPDVAAAGERTVVRPARGGGGPRDEVIDVTPETGPSTEPPTLLEPPTAMTPPAARGLEPVEPPPTALTPIRPPGGPAKGLMDEPLEIPLAEAPTEPEVTAMHAPVRRDGGPGGAGPTPVPVQNSKAQIIHLPPPGEKKRKDKGAPAAATTTTTRAEPAALPAMRGGYSIWAMLFIAIWAGGMWLTLNHPMDRKHDWKTAQNAIAARNLATEGFVRLNGGVYVTAGKGFETSRVLDPTQPPLTTWALAGWVKLFALIEGGDPMPTDRVLRAFPLACTVLALLLLFGLVKRVCGSAPALAVLAVASLMPMTAYYAQVITPAPLAAALMLIVAHGYLGWSRKPGSAVNFFIVIFGTVLACLTDWPAFFFAAMLGVAHLFQRMERPAVVEVEGVESEEEDAGPSRPIVSSIVLILVPLLMMALIVFYLKMNNRGLGDLTGAAVEVSADGKPLTTGQQYALLGKSVSDFKSLKHNFLDLFTMPALVLGAVGLVLWRAWSRRLSRASDERSRRALGRVVLSLLAAQVALTALFPGLARTWEFWQYTLVLPAAILAGGLLAWLTVAGWRPGAGDRRFVPGMFDRAGWATAALIPLAAVGPFLFRMGERTLHAAPPVKESGVMGPAWAKALEVATDPRDVILTDLHASNRTEDDAPLPGVHHALPWLADRYILADGMGGLETTTEAGLTKLLPAFKDRRVVYFWFGLDPKLAPFQKDILDKVYKRYDVPDLKVPAGSPKPTVYLINGIAGGNWKPATGLVTPAGRPGAAAPN
ncbi:MAG TPA: hypothetical protein VEA69_18435 [Tepidisphaeraceae bacterium]|nr:hypothetical protein [Tepidisphaeraceae bacterium]